MRIKIDQADKVFSQYIRTRDKECQRCHSRVQFNNKDLPVSHENSHYFGRGKESTRYDSDNCCTLCFGCHKIWGSDDKEGYRNYMIGKLGQTEFDLLELRSNTYMKKDRKMRLIEAREMLKHLVNQGIKNSPTC